MGPQLQNLTLIYYARIIPRVERLLPLSYERSSGITKMKSECFIILCAKLECPDLAH